MSKPTSTWKQVEAQIAKFFPNAKRRGADYRNVENGGGKNDIVCSGWSIEVKHSKKPTYGLMVSAVAQAESAKIIPDDIPVAIIHKEGTEYKNSLVIMRLETFANFFINQE